MSKTYVIWIACSAAIAAFAVATAAMVDWLSGVALAGGIAGIVIACRAKMPSNHKLRNGLLRSVLFLLSLGAIWTAAVDRSIFLDHCTVCYDHRYVQEDRVCGIPVHVVEGMTHRTLGSLLAGDLGRTCDHQSRRQHRVRNWGLWYSGRPAIGGMCCIMGLELQYSDAVSERVRRLAREEPDQAAELLAALDRGDNDILDPFVRNLFRGAERTIE